METREPKLMQNPKDVGGMDPKALGQGQGQAKVFNSLPSRRYSQGN